MLAAALKWTSEKLFNGRFRLFWDSVFSRIGVLIIIVAVAEPFLRVFRCCFLGADHLKLFVTALAKI